VLTLSTQVPDNLVALLNDPFLFSGNGEITTKEILKRFQDRQGQLGQLQLSEPNEVYNRHDNSNRPPAKRVETDPAIWRHQEAVKTIQDPAMPYGSNPGTPPKSWRGPDDSGHPSPYGQQQFDHSDTHLDNSDGSRQRQQEWTSSGWDKQNGGVGVGNS
jgi:hypothetical protein